ncbi:MAG TPA: DUF349 domain-containing protein [Ohtaekwangia sp.]
MERDKRDEQQESIQQAGLADNHGSKTLHSEVDLADHDHHEADEHLEEEHIDYSHFTKEQLAALTKDLSKEDNFKRVDSILKEIKPLFDDIREKEKAEALLKFIATGGIAEDFEYKGDESDIIFDANLKLIKDRKANYFHQQEERKGDNLKRKQDLLEKIRALSDVQNSDDQFEQFKELQREWKSIGPVPGAQAKTLWANYHALVDRFYDNQSIYFELKELDRKKNLEAKLELCTRAEKLAAVTIIKDAIRELNELHHEFKHIGPVPKDDKENVWQRFKTASDAVYTKRDAYLQVLQQELHVNLDNKAKLSDEVQEFSNFQSDRIKEWNQKTKEILDIQKRWEIIGGLPRAKAKEVNKKFWSAFKSFFNNKNIFFKKLDEEREKNLQLKNELVTRAIELRESNDWDRTSNELKSLQQKWKDVGPVPEKFREKVFKEFKEACDYFFEQKRTQHGKVENEQAQNLKLKEEICSLLEKHAVEGTATADSLKELQSQFNAIGFVPRKDISGIRNRYHEAVDKFVSAIQGYTEDDRSKLLLENQISDLKNDPMAERKIYQKEQAIRKKISKVENDIALWKNNLEFFSRSQNADSVRSEFNDKIKSATDHLKQLKDQLKLLKTV